MRPEGSHGNAAQVSELCQQFEQVALATFLPQSLFKGSETDAGGDPADGLFASDTAVLFGQAFAAAIERSGGLGLAPELARLLSETGS